MIQGYRNLSMSARRCLWGEFCYGLSVGAWSITFGFYLQAVGYSQSHVGQLISVGYACTAFTSLLIGRLAQLLGYSRVLMAGCLAMGCGLLLQYMSGEWHVLLFAQAAYGAGLSCIASMNLTLMVSLVPREESNGAYCMMIAMYFSSSIMGNLLAGYVPQLLPGLANPYAPMLLVCGAACFLQAALRGTFPSHAPGYTRSANHIGLGSVAKDPAVLRFLLYGLVMMGVFNIVMSMLGLVLRGRYAAGDGTVGAVQAASSLAGCATAFVLSPVVRKVALNRVAAFALALQVVVLFGMVFAPCAIFAILVALRTVANNILYVSVDNDMLQAVPHHKRGHYSGLRTCANYVGMSGGSLLAGTMVDAGHYPGLFLIGAGLAIFLLLWYIKACLPAIRAAHQFAPGSDEK